MTTTSTLNTNSTPSITSYMITGIIAGAIAGGINIILFLVGQALGVPFEIAVPPDFVLTPLTLQPIFLFSFVPGIVGAILAWIFNRFVPRGNTVFVVIAVIFLLLSFYPDIAMPETVTVGTKAMLILMHIVAGGIITYMLSRKAA
jgi:hypothetical protein